MNKVSGEKVPKVMCSSYTETACLPQRGVSCLQKVLDAPAQFCPSLPLLSKIHHFPLTENFTIDFASTVHSPAEEQFTYLLNWNNMLLEIST